MSLKNSVPIKLLLTDDYHNVSQLLSLIYQEPALNSNVN